MRLFFLPPLVIGHVLTIAFAFTTDPTMAFGRPAPDLAALFVPPHDPPERYGVYTSSDSIDLVARRMRDSLGSAADGAWMVERLAPIDGFGTDGRYDRYRLALLFGGERPRVARGPLVDNGRVTGSVTLISPYPDPSMTRLVEGTMVVVVRVVPAPKPDRTRP